MPVRRWSQEHASALFLGGIVAATLTLFLAGLWLTEANATGAAGASVFLRAVGVVLINLSGVGVAGAVATLFFSFEDVQKYLAAALARLLSEGNVVELLAPLAKARLKERLAHDLVSQSVRTINSSLYRHVEILSSGTLGAAYASNVSYAQTITSCHLPNLRRTHLVHTYRIHTGHMIGSEFPVRLFHAITIPEDQAGSLGEWLDSADVTVGDQHFSKADVECKVIPEPAGMQKYTASFSRTVKLTDPETDIRMEIRALSQEGDSVCFLARYPSSGLSATLVRDDGYIFDAQWFLYCPPDQSLPTRGYVTRSPNGISVWTHDWVLPGEGVALTIVPRTRPAG